MKEKNIALFNSILAKAEVTIILDEVHLTVSNSLMAKQKKLQWLKENLPDINLTGITATITAPVGSDREKRLISYFSPGAEQLNFLRMTDAQFQSITTELPFTAPATTKKIAGPGIKYLAGNGVCDELHFLLLLRAMATQINGFAIPDLQNVITNLLTDFSADTWIGNLIDAINSSSQLVEILLVVPLGNMHRRRPDDLW